MIRKMILGVAVGTIALLAAAGYGRTAPTTDDQALVARVAKKFFENVEPVEGWAWPPRVYILNFKGTGLDENKDGEVDGDEINCDATVRLLRPDEEPEYPDNPSLTRIEVPGIETIPGAPDADGRVKQAVLRVYQGWLDLLVRGDETRLANTFGHELAHVTLGHVDDTEAGTALIEHARQREQEAAADVRGFEYALAAGYDYDQLVASAVEERTLLSENTAFEAIRTTHPGYTERVSLVDSKRAEVWRALRAFEDGVFLLNNEQYEFAADCFEQVVEEQPKCFEGWANLGYANLMRYYNSLDEEKLREYDIGQLVVGGYYRQVGSLGVRGAAELAWERAEEALRQALVLNPNLAVARANLAAVYLLHPAGKDMGAAAREYAQVIKLLEAGTAEDTVDDWTRAALLVNAGVMEMADGDAAGAEELFAQARGLFETDAAFDSAGQVASAVQFNRAVLMARSAEAEQQKSAIEQYEQYLTTSSSALAWWTLAYEAYERLCGQHGVTAKSRDELAAAGNRRLRMVTALRMDDGQRLALNEPLATLQERLGAGLATVVARDPDVTRLRYVARGLDLWATQRLVAIRLTGRNAPALELEASGAGGGAPTELRVGMTIDEVTALLGPDGKSWDQRFGTSSGIVYQYYYNLGFGLRVTTSGKVTEIIVAQLPERAKVSG